MIKSSALRTFGSILINLFISLSLSCVCVCVFSSKLKGDKVQSHVSFSILKYITLFIFKRLSFIIWKSGFSLFYFFNCFLVFPVVKERTFSVQYPCFDGAGSICCCVDRGFFCFYHSMCKFRISIVVGIGCYSFLTW
jgi:hypothetical protein